MSAAARPSRVLPPLWLARGSRFAGWPRPRARVALLLAALIVALSYTAFAVPGPPPASKAASNREKDQRDVVLYERIVDEVAHGGNYYDVAARALREGNYPLKPFVTFRLPTLAVVQAHVPAILLPLLLYLLALGTMAAWWFRLRGVFTRAPPRIIALVLLAGGMAAFVQADLAAFHEVWAGPLIALSLALRRPGRWIEAVAVGLCAMLIRETAALYVAVMLALAWRDGERREALAWAAALAVLAIAVAFHAQAVAAVVRPHDPTSPGWAGMLGPGFFVRTMTISTALAVFPLAITAPLVALGLTGWAAWRDPTALRVVSTLAAYAVLLAIAGRTDTFYWGLLVAPLLLVGLVFVPDGLRDLVAAALDRRHITVTRSER